MWEKKKERKASLAQHICSCGKQCAKMRLEYSSSESVYCNVIVPIKLEKKKKTFIGVCFVVQLSNKLLHFLFEYASTWLMANILLQLGNEVHRFILELPIPKFRREKYYKSRISAILLTMQEEFKKFSTEQDKLQLNVSLTYFKLVKYFFLVYSMFLTYGSRTL